MQKQPELTGPKQSKLDRVVSAAGSVLNNFLATEDARLKQLEEMSMASLTDIARRCLLLSYNDTQKLASLDREFYGLVQEILDSARSKAQAEFETEKQAIEDRHRDEVQALGNVKWAALNLADDLEGVKLPTKAADMLAKLRGFLNPEEPVTQS